MDNSNIYKLTVTQTAELLTRAYVALINGKAPLKLFPSVMLWGAPGVGKSQGVRHIAEMIRKKTNKKVVITDVRLLLFNPVDLRGIPTSNSDKTAAVWLRPQIFNMDSSKDVVNILFLDEISAAPQSVQAAAYQLTLDRTVGEHKLPDNCIVIAAGNRVTDRSVAYAMPKALANRLCHIEINCDAYSWCEWAKKNGVDNRIVQYILANPDRLLEDSTDNNSQAYATPRSWEMVSNILKNISPDISSMLPLVSGCIGSTEAYRFGLWCDTNGDTPALSEIFDGVATSIPTHPESLFELINKMKEYALSHRKKDGVLNSVKYASAMPDEFKDALFYDYLTVKQLRVFLMESPEFNIWFESKGLFWEDYTV